MKKREFIGGTLAVLAFFWLVGTVGALECENITCLQSLVQGGIGLLVGWFGLHLANAELD